MCLAPGVDRIEDVPSTAVVGTDGQCQAFIGFGGGLALGDEFPQASIEAGQIPHHLEAHAVFGHLGHFPLQGHDEEFHQAIHLVLGTAPVLGAEGEQGEIFHPPFDACLDHVPHPFHTLGMAGNTRHEAFLGPAAVAIHDDGDVPGNLDGVRDIPGGAEKAFDHDGL